MRYSRIMLSVENAYIDTYFLNYSRYLYNSSTRPLILICPGGGYEYNSDREKEPIAMAFAAHGFHTAVLHYPCAPIRFPAALLALTEAVALIRESADENHIDASNIAVCGFSAGGHLAASLAAFWDTDYLYSLCGYEKKLIQPNYLLLAYPVITSGKYTHRRSMDNLIGKNASDELLELVSLEKQISSSAPPTFVWHTYNDQTVPVENSLLLVQALNEHEVPFELHIFSDGAHGLALCNEQTRNENGALVQEEYECWVDMASNWLWRSINQ